MSNDGQDDSNNSFGTCDRGRTHGERCSRAAESAKAGKQPGSGQSGMMTGNIGDLMGMRSQMMADMKAMDASLDQKVAAMDAAEGKAKVDAMAAAVNEMVAQRNQMMAHVGGHMAQAGSTGMRQSMALCPMMKGMKDMDDNSASAH